VILSYRAGQRWDLIAQLGPEHIALCKDVCGCVVNCGLRAEVGLLLDQRLPFCLCRLGADITCHKAAVALARWGQAEGGGAILNQRSVSNDSCGARGLWLPCRADPDPQLRAGLWAGLGVLQSLKLNLDLSHMLRLGSLRGCVRLSGWR